MYRDVVDLREFYASSLGQVTRRLVRRRIRQVWPDLRGQRVLGLGYTTPYLRGLRDEAERVVAFMPARQGVSYWPPEGPCQTALVDEGELPLPDMSVDRVLLVHGLECTEQLRPMMREIWRVLADGGRLLAVVPNRSGVWARSERTPFGYGFPYSAQQLKTSLRDNMFVPEQTARALFIPPTRWRFLLAGAHAWERVGERWLGAFGGVYLIEASKQLYATPLRRTPARRERRGLIVPTPQSLPGAARVNDRSGHSATIHRLPTPDDGRRSD